MAIFRHLLPLPFRGSSFFFLVTFASYFPQTPFSPPLPPRFLPLLPLILPLLFALFRPSPLFNSPIYLYSLYSDLPHKKPALHSSHIYPTPSPSFLPGYQPPLTWLYEHDHSLSHAHSHLFTDPFPTKFPDALMTLFVVFSLLFAVNSDLRVSLPLLFVLFPVPTLVHLPSVCPIVSTSALTPARSARVTSFPFSYLLPHPLLFYILSLFPDTPLFVDAPTTLLVVFFATVCCMVCGFLGWRFLSSYIYR